ncbi:MAG: ribbon-helix-helix protein, CopG family [Candidatus Woesearchaeota archaeon]|nr:ribbon-helix-helix protein, CopG family [Candidatus Woesearchaeota archaeon]
MKKPISATIDEELIEWINSQLANKTRYRNKSHIIEVALEQLRKELEEQKQKDKDKSKK